MTLSCLLITVGQVISYAVGYLMSETPHGWRWMVGLAAAPACVQLLTLFFLPESARWLVKRKRRYEATVTLQMVFGSAPEARRIVAKVLRGIEEEVLQEEEIRRTSGSRHVPDDASWWSTLFAGSGTFFEIFAVGGHRRALTIACLLQGLQQLCGFVSLLPTPLFLAAAHQA